MTTIQTEEKSTELQLAEKLQEAHKQVEVGAIYIHYRNPDLNYKVLGLALQEATEEVCVVYQALYGSQLLWVRNLDSWTSLVTHEGKSVPRFQQKL